MHEMKVIIAKLYTVLAHNAMNKKAPGEGGYTGSTGGFIQHGVAHHASVVYGNYIEPFRIAARIAAWEFIEWIPETAFDFI